VIPVLARKEKKELNEQNKKKKDRDTDFSAKANCCDSTAAKRK
jgi:hypothetical protein